MDKIGEDIETIREKEKPQNKRDPSPSSPVAHKYERKNIWHKCEDEIPDESVEVGISRHKKPHDGESDSKKTENEIGRKMHNYDFR